jgi:AraC-like DNA-binding protein
MRLARLDHSTKVETSMARPPTVLAGVVSSLLRSAAAAGVHAAQLENDVGLCAKDLEDNDARIPVRAYDAIWIELATQIDDPTFGLGVGTARTESSLGIVGYLAMSSGRLGEALTRASRLFKLINEAGNLKVEYSTTTVSLSRSYERRPLPLREDAFLASVLALAQRWTRRRILPLEIHLADRVTGDLRPLEQFFRCPIQPGREISRIVFAKEHLERQLLRADPQLARYLERIAEHQLRQLRYESELVEKLVEFLSSVGQETDRSLDAAAEHLGTSRRTLQRRLEQNGLVYRDIVDTARRKQALEVLHSNLSVQDAASALGYSDVSSFRRAVRRWTGMSPSAYQRALRRLRIDVLP